MKRASKTFLGFLIPLLCVVAPPMLHALEIAQTSGVWNKEPYQVLELRSIKPFPCELTPPSRDTNGSLSCFFDRVPALRPHSLKNRFFTVTPLLDERSFAVRVDFHHRAQVYPLLSETLSDEPLVPSDLGRKASRWLVVGYVDKPPHLAERPHDGLSFPVVLPAFDPPVVGPLDAAGSPIGSQQAADDAGFYAQALLAYKRGDLPESLRMVNQALDISQERSLFLPELLALKVRILDALGGSEVELIEIAEHWVRAYTTHADLPEMMLLLTRALISMGRTGDAFYYADLLIREFPKSRFADLALIYKSDRFLAEGRVGEATYGYDRVVFHSQDLPAAALAASRLADIAIKEDDLGRAAGLYEKILLSHPPFFLDDRQESEDLLIMFSEHRLLRPAALLAEVLIEDRDQTEDDYADHLRNLARWQLMADMKSKALENYKDYLDLYEFAPDRNLIRKEHDLLEFDLGVEGHEAQLALYDRIITRYPQDEAASRALYEMAKLLLQLGRYAEVADLLPALDRLDPELFFDYAQQIRQMERTLLNSFIIQDRCAEAVGLISQRGLGASLRRDEPLYHCAWREHDYTLSGTIIEHHLLQNTPAKSIPWIERRLDLLYSTSATNSYLDESLRYLRMQRALGHNVSPERYYQIAAVHHQSRDALGALEKIVQTVADRFPKDARNIDTFAYMVDVARWREDDNLLYTYAKKLVNHQRLLGVSTLSPFAELSFAQGAMAIGRPNEAITILQSHLQEEMPLADRVRVLYRLGEVLEEDARPQMAAAVYERCANYELQGDDWAELCRQRTAL